MECRERRAEPAVPLRLAGKGSTSDIFAKRRLNVPQKLDFVQACGLFSGRTLTRLNALRNKVEHQFEVPRISDVEIYFDLVCAFVATIESALSAWTQHDMVIRDPKIQGRFGIECDPRLPKISVAWEVGRKAVEFESTPADLGEFAFMMKIAFFLDTRASFASDSYILKQLART